MGTSQESGKRTLVRLLAHPFTRWFTPSCEPALSPCGGPRDALDKIQRLLRYPLVGVGTVVVAAGGPTQPGRSGTAAWKGRGQSRVLEALLEAQSGAQGEEGSFRVVVKRTIHTRNWGGCRALDSDSDLEWGRDAGKHRRGRWLIPSLLAAVSGDRA